MKIEKLPTIHHLIFSVCPILFLYIHNLKNAYIAFPLVILYCFLSLFLTEIVYLLIKLILKDEFKASIVTSSFFIFIFFFPYGHLFNQPVIRISSYLAYFLSLSSFLAIFLVTVKTKNNLVILTKYLNSSSVLLILIILINGVVFSFEKNAPLKDREDKTVYSQNALHPDIYYIVLDAYARQDILQKLYGYDNSEFINYLRQSGFFVADKSRANYNMTTVSLASSLNFEYLDDISMSMGENSSDLRPLIRMIKRSKIRNYLSSCGYRFILFSSGLYDTEIKDADFYIEPVGSLAKITEYEGILFNNNLIGFLLKNYLVRLEYEIHKTRINETLNQLPLVSAQKTPVFVFAHIMSPHPPFVFSDLPLTSNYIFADGSSLHHNMKDLKQLYVTAYCDQIRILNLKLKACLDKILKRTKNESIIIIQSDHGPRLLYNWGENPISSDFSESMSILNAIYLPESAKDGLEELPDDITPVNIFRFILRKYFSENLELLEDKSFVVLGLHKPYKYIPYEAGSDQSK